MSSFTEATVTKLDVRTPPVFLWFGSRPYYRINEGFRYYIGHVGSNVFVDVPAGFITDFVSAPWLVDWIFDRKRAAKSAAVHDRCREDESLSLLEGNCFFHMAMETEKTPWLQREVYALAVRFNRSRIKHQSK
ncbi:tail protein [Caulobacter phage Seuss]|uniref:Tail protein n=1 Tax=Caulobacter phage Seuss TaxID=1675601 RepID=A0A0K1LM35_9CAUD|nr:tail assembly chaperone [Caulobacter phage Seuss]AKU43566.1 tail protein [Caulobacter phage Seuss]